MKPGEFDDLVRQKFDQNDFEYNPRNWDKLNEELDGKRKNRMMLVWWIPLLGVAASVAMAFGVSAVLRQGSGVTDGGRTEYANLSATGTPAAAPLAARTLANSVAANNAAIYNGITAHNATAQSNAHHHVLYAAAVKAKATVSATSASRNDDVTLQIDNTKTYNKKDADLNSKSLSLFSASTPKISANAFAKEDEYKKNRKKAVVVNKGYYTFKEVKEPWKTPKAAILLSGGVNYGNQSNGYTIGASARRMVNDHVYVEGEIAFVGTNNTSKESVYDKTITVTTNSGVPSPVFGAKNSLNKNSTTEAAPKATTTSQDIYKTVEKPYNLYYAQINPTIGYKLMRRMSVGVGPDFQQMLVDNRPAASPAERGNIQVAPMFDIGFMGKTEYAVSKNIRAAVYYREGINNIITPTNKYIDRNYLQLQVKCTILNR